MNVLSLFNGIGSIWLALDKANIQVDNRYSSEIDKHSNKVNDYHYTDTIQLGCVKQVDGSRLKKIDLLVGGSPCQGFSYSGKKLNFEDPRSALFWEFVRLLKETKPKYFLLENVTMKKEWQDIISESLGVEPILINSSLVSAQLRKRLYWTNIPNITLPEDKDIVIGDILDNRDYSLNAGSIIGRRLDEFGKRKDYDKTIPLIQYIEVRKDNLKKSKCLTTVDKDNILTHLDIGRHPNAFENKHLYRYFTLSECCRLQNIPEDYFYNLVSESKGKKMLGNGWTIDVISHILSKINS